MSTGESAWLSEGSRLILPRPAICTERSRDCPGYGHRTCARRTRTEPSGQPICMGCPAARDRRIRCWGLAGGEYDACCRLTELPPPTPPPATYQPVLQSGTAPEKCLPASSLPRVPSFFGSSLSRSIRHAVLIPKPWTRDLPRRGGGWGAGEAGGGRRAGVADPHRPPSALGVMRPRQLCSHVPSATANPDGALVALPLQNFPSALLTGAGSSDSSRAICEKRIGGHRPRKLDL